MANLKLNFELDFYDLYKREGLVKLDLLFIDFIKQHDTEVHNLLVEARKVTPSKIEYSNLIIKAGRVVEKFIVSLFNIEQEYDNLFLSHKEYDNLYLCKRLFVQRRALKAYRIEEINEFKINEIEEDLKKLISDVTELNFSNYVMLWLKNDHQENLNLASKFAAWACTSDEGKRKYKDWIIFQLPKKIDPQNLIPLETEIINDITILRTPNNVSRKGFNLTDAGDDLKHVLDYANYCIYCHNQNKDSCSTGMKNNDSSFKIDAHNVTLAGCPLEEKISEMNKLKSEGYFIGALAAAIIDNPMLAATGHRICNDCMKSCIYQKQEPVNIPQIETKTLKDVLALPWGFEIYSLLTRWNPLNIERPIPKKSTNNKILVAGLGPAGFTLSHHLLNDGHIVVGIDALKIEPLNSSLSGVEPDGSKTNFEPIYNVETIYEDLSSRIQAGFGGVTEYGITVRWNKNFLKVIRTLLERRENFSMIGGVRFGSQITTKDAFALGFDHITLALGAGAPTLLNINNAMSRGVRTASDFLMSLQLSGAAKADSLSNLQLRLPVVVIGGGLTATDAATEALAYYPVQVEKFLTRYENNIAIYGAQKTKENWSEEDNLIAEEFITHARLFREENKKGNPDILSIINKLGGVKILYRGKFENSPAYRYNAEELEHALNEGVKFVENFTLKSIELDKYAHIYRVVSDENKYLDSKTVLYAAGTSPNTILVKEDNINYSLDGNYFKAIDSSGNILNTEKSTKPNEVNILTSKYQNKYVSFIGDLHPSYSGNVVKAMKSAKDAYPVISKLVSNLNASQDKDFLSHINKLFRARIHKIEKLTDNIVEIIVEAPLAAKMFEPGQFYKFQNFETLCNSIEGTKLAMEGIALTGAIAYKEQGLLSLIALEVGASSNLCKTLQIGEYISLMGPTGTATEIFGGKTILLLGGGLGNAVLFSIGKAFREKGSKVIYFAGYRKLTDRYKISEIENAADKIIWCCDEGILPATRQGDQSYHGNIVDALIAYTAGQIDNSYLPLTEVDHIISIGSDKMMKAVNYAREYMINSHLKPNCEAVASINSPMQCMAKEICAQCIQKHIDKDTGLVTYVYSCHTQDQDMNKVDFDHLAERLKQNSVQEKNTSLWLDYCLSKEE